MTIALTVGLTQLLKEAFGLKGSRARAVGVLIGLALGIGERLAQLSGPLAYADFFGIFTYGLVIGLTSVGLYAAGDKLAEKAAQGK